MRLKLSIAQQGVALALIPLVFEVFFLAALINALQDNEKGIQKQFFYRSIVEKSNELQRSALDCAKAASIYNLYGREDLKKSKDEKSVKLLQELSALQNLCQEEPALAKPLNEVKQATQEMFNDLFEDKPMRRNTAPGFKALEGMMSVFSQSLTTDIVDGLHACYETVAQLDKKRSESQLESERYLNKIIIVGVIVNILISFILAALFSKNITSRLAVLNDNARRMKLRQPLNEPVRGNDEITTLDTTFHEMASGLQEADSQKKELLSFMSTQLQVPLKRILNHLQSTQERQIQNEKLQKRLKPLRGNVLRLCSLIEELLNVESIDSGKMILSISSCSLKSILEGATSTMQGYAASKNLNIALEETGVKVEVDVTKIEQVIINLLSNAIKYSPEGSTIEIKTQNQNTDSIEIVVIDHGPGIPEEKLGLLFERFKQANPVLDTKIGGSGLGLNICKKIVQAHGGELGIKSEIDRGSQFWFRLPLIHERTEANA